MPPVRSTPRGVFPAANAATMNITSRPVTARKTLKKTETQGKLIFRGLALSIAGKISSSEGAVIPHEDIVRWFQAHGGSFTTQVEENTTHLICSIEEFKKGGPQVLKAMSFSSARHQCHIVGFDWLEDSLIGVKKRRRDEKRYTLDRTIKRLRGGKTKDEIQVAKGVEGIKTSKELCDSKLHRVYRNQDGFEYKINLTRASLSGTYVMKEKYTLFLFESIAMPHTYMFGAKLSRSSRPLTYYREECRPKPFHEAMGDFENFYYQKTKIQWDDRFEKVETPKDCFRYEPPLPGRPTGLLPLGYVRPELRQTEGDSKIDCSDSQPRASSSYRSRMAGEPSHQISPVR